MMRSMALLFLFISLISHATEQADVGDVGPHYPLFRFEKNVRPENVMIVYTKLDSKCQLAKDPMLGFYWLMKGATYKPVHPVIEQNIRKRLSILSHDAHSLKLSLNDVKELGSELKTVTLNVGTRSSKGICELETIAAVDEAGILVHAIRSETKRTILPPFHKLVALSITGNDPRTGADVTKTISIKR